MSELQSPRTTPSFTPIVPDVLPTVYSPNYNSPLDAQTGMDSYADDAKIETRRARGRKCALVGLALVLIAFGMLLGTGMTSAVLVPVLTRNNNNDADKVNKEPNVTVVTPPSSDSTSSATPFELVAETRDCDFGCPPSAPWCPPGAVCECEKCAEGESRTALAAAESSAFRMRVYARGRGAEVREIARRLPCWLVSPHNKSVVGENCTNRPGDSGDGSAGGSSDAAGSGNATVRPNFSAASDGARAAAGDDRIEGGSYTSISNYPHQVAVLSAGGTLCGGNILNKDWVLTAAHCCSGNTVNSCGLRVLFGSTTLYGYGGGGGSCTQSATNSIYRCASEYHMHPNYDPTYLYYDICLIRVAQPFSGNNWKPISIMSSVPADGTALRAVGWGLNYWGGSVQSNLKHVTLYSQRASTMRRTWGNWIHDGVHGGKADNSGTCSGDSGGPLIYYSGSTPYLLGVTSFVVSGDCSHPYAANAFWRATYHLGWLQNTMALTSPCVQSSPCTAPTSNSEGCSNVPDGGTCTPRCSTGYTLVDPQPGTTMRCNDGTWSRSFTCHEQCSTPNVQYATGCNAIDHRGECVPQCSSGYAPSSSASLTCIDGAYDNSFTCVSTACGAIDVQHGTCAETAPYADGSTCTPKCSSGYSVRDMTVTEIKCNNRVWSGTFSCKASCSTPTNAHARGCESVADGQTCKPQCAPGYSPTPTSALTCSDGVYTSSFECRADPCTALVVESGECQEGSGPFESGSVCTPTCADGYKAVATSSPLSCSLGEWSGTYSCKASCGATNVNNSAGCDSVAHGESCTPACTEGYQLVNYGGYVCNDGVYEGQGFECKPTTCDQMVVADGAGSCCEMEHFHGSTCSAKCNVGYTLVGSTSFQCHNGVWDGSFDCKQKCTTPPVEHAVGCNPIEHGGTCKPACAEGFAPSSNNLLSCSDGRYSGSFTCVPTECPAPAVTNGGCKEAAPHSTGSTCTTSCDSGYSLVGSATMTCQHGGWDGSFDCKQKCTTPPVQHAVGCTDVAHGGSCTPQCSVRYAPSSTMPIQCKDGQYSSTFTCESTDCPAWNVANGGCVESAPHTAGSTCTAQCADGFTLVGSGSLNCAGGSWDGAFSCKKQCTTPTNVNAVGCESVEHGGMCTPQCAAGYAPSTMTALTCSDGSYGGTFVCEQTQCPAPAIPSGSCVEGGPYSFTGTKTCTLQCGAGYEPSLASDAALTCESDGSWSGSVECVASPCNIGTLCGPSMSTLASGSKCTPSVCEGDMAYEVECTRGELKLHPTKQLCS